MKAGNFITIVVSVGVLCLIYKGNTGSWPFESAKPAQRTSLSEMSAEMKRFSKHQRPTEKELIQMLRDGNFDEASRWLTMEQMFERAALMDMADAALKHQEDEGEDESDRDYYAAVESLRNDKKAYTFKENEDLIFSIPKEINAVKVAYPTMYTDDSEITFKVYVDGAGIVMNANIIKTFKAFSESNELPQEHIDSATSALLNTIFEAGTPNQFNVTYSHYSPRPNQL